MQATSRRSASGAEPSPGTYFEKPLPSLCQMFGGSPVHSLLRDRLRAGKKGLAERGGSPGALSGLEAFDSQAHPLGWKKIEGLKGGGGVDAEKKRSRGPSRTGAWAGGGQESPM